MDNNNRGHELSQEANSGRDSAHVIGNADSQQPRARDHEDGEVLVRNPVEGDGYGESDEDGQPAEPRSRSRV